MANIFISYGDDRFKESLKRIGKHAKRTKLFDKIILYTPNDLPLYIKSSPLFAFKRGGGYWVWKPWVIYHTLQECKDGDVVYYADAGCSLNPNSIEWNKYFDLIKSHNAIFFQYRLKYDYGWGKYCTSTQNNSAAIKHWMKPLTVNYFRDYLGHDDFLEYAKIWAGACIIRKDKEINVFMDEWLKISLFHPELIIDPWGEELKNLPSIFNEHRHDQAIITPLIYYYRERCNILVLQETSESKKETAAIITDRFIQGRMPFIPFLKYKIYNFIHGL